MRDKPTTDFAGHKGSMDMFWRDRFDRIDRDTIKLVAELKVAVAEFDAYRHAWAEMSANDSPPGRGSPLAKQLEIMQGYALSTLDNAAWRLRLKIRGEQE